MRAGRHRDLRLSAAAPPPSSAAAESLPVHNILRKQRAPEQRRNMPTYLGLPNWARAPVEVTHRDHS